MVMVGFQGKLAPSTGEVRLTLGGELDAVTVMLAATLVVVLTDRIGGFEEARAS
jgi:hypothetical protein